MIKKILTILVVLMVLPVGSLVASEQSPTADLKPILEDLTSVLGDESLKGNDHLAERRAKIMSNVKKGFDFREMSKRVLGRTWNDIDEKEQEHFTTLMTKLLENVYVGKLEGYSGQKIEYAAESIKEDRAQVTTFIDNNEVKIPVHYICERMKSAGWFMISI